ncbi:MAG TPA: hypothetical protein EYP10_09770, partial [Armatimonadetes bacterium]|nr:hypothetical protein [Armatimonadota bacterium]
LTLRIPGRDGIIIAWVSPDDELTQGLQPGAQLIARAPQPIAPTMPVTTTVTAVAMSELYQVLRGMDVTSPSSRAGETAIFMLRITKRDTESDGRIAIDLPHGCWAEPSSKVRLNAIGNERRMQRLILVHWSERMEAGIIQVPVRFERDLSSTSVNIRPPRKRITVPRIDGVTIDGDLSDWHKYAEIRLNGIEGNNVKNWDGEDDLSAEVWLAWSPRALYFAARITDDIHVNKFSGADIWRGDCIQIAFDALMDTLTGYDANDVEVGLALANDVAYVHQWYPQRRPCPQIKLCVQREGNITLYETAIPWELLRLRPAVGLRVAFSFTVNENDGKDFDGWLEWTPGICGKKDATSFGALVLE